MCKCVVNYRFCSEPTSWYQMLQCQDIIAQVDELCVHCTAGKGMTACGLADPVTWRLKVCRCQSNSAHMLRGFGVCIHLSSSVTSACGFAMTGLTSFCIPKSLWLPQSRSCAGGVGGVGRVDEALQGSRGTLGNMLSLPEKTACQRFATQRRGQCIWTWRSHCCHWAQVRIRDRATMKGTWPEHRNT